MLRDFKISGLYEKIKALDFDHTLFPVVIPENLKSIPIFSLHLSYQLAVKLAQVRISTLGQLNGLTLIHICCWKHFNQQDFLLLCSLFQSMRNSPHVLMPIPDLKKDQPSLLDYLPPQSNFDFPLVPTIVFDLNLEDLNLPTITRNRLHKNFGICTISDFVKTNLNLKYSKPQFNRIRPIVLNELSKLIKVGMTEYLQTISLNKQSFSTLIAICKPSLNPREAFIFDFRFYVDKEKSLTLEYIGQELGITRERVRQLENILIKYFQNNRFREYGWLIRRKCIDILQTTNQPLPYESFLKNPFFTGYTYENSSFPAPINFLSKVFYSTFDFSENSISIKPAIAR